MIIEIHRAEQHSDAVNSGFADYAYSFEPIVDRPTVEGCGGGVYGTCTTDDSDVVLQYEVPDDSRVGPTKDDAGDALFVPGVDTGYAAVEVVFNPRFVRVRGWLHSRRKGGD